MNSRLFAIWPFYLALLLASACGKVSSPVEPNVSLPSPVNTIFPKPAEPDETIIVAGVHFQNQPLAQVQCTLEFAGRQPVTMPTDQQGKVTFAQPAQGGFALTIPEQGDILGGCHRGSIRFGETQSIGFQGGGSISLVPDKVQYAYAGHDQTYQLLCAYAAGENNLAVKLRPEIMHFPSIWKAAFSAPELFAGLGNTLTVTVAKGSCLNAFDLQIIGRAGNDVIKVVSPSFAIFRDWEPYAEIRVVVDNGGVPLENVRFVIKDAKGGLYEGLTRPNAPLPEQYVRLNASGAFCVDVPRQGYVSANHINGSIAQAEQQTITFAVGKATTEVRVLHADAALSGAVVTIIDANQRTYPDLLVDGTGLATFTLGAVGPFKAWLRGDSSRYYEDSFLPGEAYQNGLSRITFQGRPGSMSLGNPHICYPYAGGEYPVRMDYAKEGDINYYLLLNAAGLPDPSRTGISGSFDQRLLTNHAPAYFNLRVNKYSFWETGPGQGIQIYGATYNHPLAFQLAPEPVVVIKGWNVSVDLAPQPAVMRKYQETPPNFKAALAFTVTAVGMPQEFEWGFNFDLPYREQGFMPVYDSASRTNSGQVPGSGVIIIWGNNRHGWAVPELYRDGKAYLDIYFDGHKWGSQVDLWY